MDIKYFIVIACLILYSCNDSSLRKDYFYYVKLNKCIEIELDANYLLVDHDSSELSKYYSVDLEYKHQKFKNLKFRIAYPILYTDALDADSSASFSDAWLEAHCQNLQQNPAINEIHFCKLLNIDNFNFLTFGYSEHSKHQGYNIYYESHIVDFKTPKIFTIKTTCYNEKIDKELVKKMHFDIIENLRIESDCQKNTKLRFLGYLDEKRL